jgi:tripartite-type tricarboxylate transporter receptor subunit TctC
MARTRKMLILCGVLLCAIADARAQTYPSGPIRWLVGFTAGGTADMISRDIGSHLEKTWGQPVIIENRPGANGSTATAALATAKPDGQTLNPVGTHHQCVPLSRTAVRSAQGLRAGQPRRVLAARDCRQSGFRSIRRQGAG